MSCVASALTAAGFSLPGSSGEPVTPQTLNKYLVDNEGCVHARTQKMLFFSLAFLTHLILHQSAAPTLGPLFVSS
jgi:hypothetical protein